jgi:excisionase family DNA binding protein
MSGTTAEVDGKGRTEIADGCRGKPYMFRKDAVEMVSNGVIGRRLLNVREAAQYLGLEVDTVYKKSRLREVPCVKVGRALRFDVKALERYIEQHTIETID